MLATHTLVQL